jgi:hypothetical protein
MSLPIISLNIDQIGHRKAHKMLCLQVFGPPRLAPYLMNFLASQRSIFWRWSPTYNLQHGQVKSKSSNFFSLGAAEKSFTLECVHPKVASHCRMQSSWNMWLHSLLDDQHTLSDISYLIKHAAQKIWTALSSDTNVPSSGCSFSLFLISWSTFHVQKNCMHERKVFFSSSFCSHCSNLLIPWHLHWQYEMTRASY